MCAIVVRSTYAKVNDVDAFREEARSHNWDVFVSEGTDEGPLVAVGNYDQGLYSWDDEENQIYIWDVIGKHLAPGWAFKLLEVIEDTAQDYAYARGYLIGPGGLIGQISLVEALDAFIGEDNLRTSSIEDPLLLARRAEESSPS